MKIVGDEVKFIKISDSDLINNIMVQGFFVDNVLQTSAIVLRGKTEGVVLDIGANMGSFTIPLAYYNPQYTFVCFEPQRMVCYQLCGNVAINRLNNVVVHNVALGSERTQLLLDMPDYENESNIGAFSLDKEVREHNDYLCSTKGVKQKVDVLTLDSKIHDTNIALIKIDVEGMELEVIKGGLELLKNNSYPPILFESWESKAWFKPRRQELFNFLEDLGYEIQSFGEDNLAIYKGE